MGMTPLNFFDVRKLAILADCHIHPSAGSDWTPAILKSVSGTDLIVTLGDMGETVGLDRLGALAPVIGVRGRDDAEDTRTSAELRVLQLGKVRIGCVFDPTDHGMASHADPFTPSTGWTEIASALFGAPIQVLLHASTHRANVADVDGILVVNPGSAVLPAAGAGASFALLTVDDGRVEAEIVSILETRQIRADDQTGAG
jgi:putative phosphoesterase